MRPTRCLPLLPLVLALVLPSRLPAGSAAETAILPPALPWDGTSRALVAAPDDPWITPAEVSGFARTPSYEETFAWLRKLVAVTPELSLVSLGQSGEGRELWMVVASAERAFSPRELAETGKPILLVQAGIHSGEIDGKDAGLMLLRDLTVGRRNQHLLEKASFLFVPIFNVDGHERSSAFGRINQRGPEAMGWRTTARNLNLNRDYAKLDAPETRALVRALNAWQPDLYVDVHVTDGADYQYDITWGYAGRHAGSPAIATWLDEVLTPALVGDLQAQGHVPGPLIFFNDDRDPSQGITAWTATPRFSDGYGSLRHQPTILVENHSLKPYAQRVLGTYVLLAGMLETLGQEGKALRQAIAQDRERRPAELALTWKLPETPPETVELLGVASRREPGVASGGEKVVWTGEPVTLTVPRRAITVPDLVLRRPTAYWVPAAWSDVIERLEAHGILLERLVEARTLEVDMYRVGDAALEPEPFEGHARVSLTAPALERQRETFLPGAVRVPTDQPLGDLAMVLLEPLSPDSFFQWGFFLEILQRTEYVEAYVMEPMAERMLAEDPALKAEFEKRLADDPAFAADPRARLQWFYQRTPFFDERWRLYPVAREP